MLNVKKIVNRRLRKLQNGWLKDRLISLACRRIGQAKFTGESCLGDGVESIAAELADEGLSLIGRPWNDAELASIIQFAQQTECERDVCSPNADGEIPTQHFFASDPPEDCRTAEYSMESLLGNKQILDLANDPGILSVAQKFLGAMPTITAIRLWWSFPNGQEAYGPQLFHRDNDGLKFLKLFVYLSDVDPDSGPHIYVRGSSRDRNLNHTLRLSDREIVDTYGEQRIESLCHPLGTAFLEDTYGFHKGLPPTTNRRLVLQVEYGLHPILIESYHPTAVDYDTSARQPSVSETSRFTPKSQSGLNAVNRSTRMQTGSSIARFARPVFRQRCRDRHFVVANRMFERQLVRM